MGSKQKRNYQTKQGNIFYAMRILNPKRFIKYLNVKMTLIPVLRISIIYKAITLVYLNNQTDLSPKKEHDDSTRKLNKKLGVDNTVNKYIIESITVLHVLHFLMVCYALCSIKGIVRSYNSSCNVCSSFHHIKIGANWKKDLLLFY